MRGLFAQERGDIDETGFLKQGKASCGVGRQYTGSVGKITNCQIGVFAVYVSRRSRAFIERALYLPKACTCPRRVPAQGVDKRSGSNGGGGLGIPGLGLRRRAE
jgi:hypothetical protein